MQQSVSSVTHHKVHVICTRKHAKNIFGEIGV